MNLPEYKNIRIRKTQGGKYEVLDILRHRFVALTPEEWVRQHFMNYLITEKGYPSALMANEVELRVRDKRLRCDGILYNRQGIPRVIMEYKAESVALTEKVVMQITTYNMLLHVNYLMVSNGIINICMHYNQETGKWMVLPEIPHYDELEN